MNDLLKKYYNIEIDNFKYYNEGILFFVNGYNYYFVKCYYDEKYLNYLKRIVDNYESVKLHRFIANKDGSLLSDGYVLLEMRTLIDDITLNDIKLFSSVGCNESLNYYVSMDKFWEEKIDYLELQLSELSANKLINNSFDYYLGISEILISYLKKINIENNIRLSLSHRSMRSLSTIDYYNPLNICFDHYLKDIAGYIRLFNNMDLIYNLVEKIKDVTDYQYLFVRLVFPFNYFYELSSVLIDGNDEIALADIINHIKEYENYLLWCEELFGIYLFSWIKKSN